MRAHEIVDRALGRRAVIAGSLPPSGRDLDVIIGGVEDAALVERALRDAGFVPLGTSWLRFAHMTAELVELVPAADLGVSDDAVRALFAEAIVLDGCERLARPSPAHAVLLLARKVGETGELTPKRRLRLDAALQEDPAAWLCAEERAAGWRGRAALEALERARSQRGEEHRSRVWRVLPAGVRPRLGAARDRLRGRHRGAVIALSGLDGAGKSTQAHALRDALERLGFEVAVEWTRIGDERSWHAVPRPLRPTAMTLDQLWRQRRRIGGWLVRDFVVVCDRYTLDSIVSLHCLIDERRRFRLQRLLLGALTRRPAAAFLLDVPPEVAWRRKGEHGLESLRRHHAVYRSEHARLGVVRLDGELAPEQLAARIARESFAALGPR